MKTFLAIVGADDPYFTPSVGDLRIKGPILSVLQHRAFDRIICIAVSGFDDSDPQFRNAINANEGAIVTITSPRVTSDHLAAMWPDNSEIYALAGEASAESALLSMGRAFTLLRVKLSPFPADDVVIEDVLINHQSAAVRETPGSYAVNMNPPALRVVSRTAARNLKATANEAGIIGEHPALLHEIEKAAAVAGHAVPVLIHGETGTGKGMLAKFIHEQSDRSGGPFVAINCGALPENLAESLLFGHVKGSFTGAHADQAGKFVLSDNGTLFLDEVGELPAALQPKLLRVLEDGLVEPLGAAKGRKVNVRVIAATHRDLKKDVAEKKFREDLFYRLSFATVSLPPLRERRSDIPAIALHIISRLNRRLQRPKSFKPDALQFLESQYWRGNVRDLENAIGRTVLMSKAEMIGAKDLLLEDDIPVAGSATPEPHEGFSLEGFLSAARTDLIDKALRKTSGNKSAAARLLGVSAQAVHKFAKTRKV